MEQIKSIKNYNAGGSPNGGAGSLREEQEDRQRLEKNNFDLKMKVYYLEESLKRFQDGETNYDVQSDSAKSEITNLKLQLEEKHIELDQRNLILMKAKSAIEALKFELERLRSENEKQHDLEERVKKLKQLNDEMGADFHQQITQMEIQLTASRQLANSKEQERSFLEEKLTQLQQSYSVTHHKADELSTDKDKIQEQWLQAQQRISMLEDELTQSRAHVDLYSLQLEEKSDDLVESTSRFKELYNAKLAAEDDFKQRYTELSSQYEMQIRTMRQNHEQEVERLREGHVKMLGDIRENYSTEINLAKNHLERSLSEAKLNDSQDLARLRDDFNLRLAEKNEEIKALRAVIETDRARTSAVTQELELTRNELKRKVDAADALLTESNSKSEELKIAELIRRELHQSRAELVELKEQMKREESENAHKSARLEQVSSTLESAREIIRDQETALTANQVEIARLVHEANDLGNKADAVENISRDNERLKTIHNQLQTEILELNHKYSDQRRDLNQATEQAARLASEVSALKNQLGEGRGEADILRRTLEALQETLQKERERASAAEAALQEHRNMMVTTRSDLDKERSAKLQAEQEVNHTGEQVEAMRRNLGNACNMAYRAMAQWDSSLSSILDGDMFREVNQHHNNTHTSTSSFNGSSNVMSIISRLNSNKGFSAKAAPVVSGANRITKFPGSSFTQQQRLEQEEAEAVEAEIAQMDSDQLLQSVAIKIERVNLKIERTKKIRSLFDAQSQRLVQTVQNDLITAQERASLLFHKVSEAVGDVTTVKGVLDRDRKQREDELQQMKNFREVLLGEHSAQMRDSESRYGVLAQQLEQEKHNTERAKQHVAELKEELRAMQVTCNELRSELKDLEKTERMVSDLSIRASELGETNRLLGKEIDHKNQSLHQLAAELNDLKAEKVSLMNNLDKLTNQVATRDEALQDSEGKLARYAKEIDRLRTRQINPELAQTILDTQSILQSTARGSSVSGHRSPTNSSHAHSHSSSAQASVFVEQLQSVVEVVNVANELINRSADSISIFESLLQQHSSHGKSHVVATLEQDLIELLELNSRVTVQVHQVASDLKRAVRRHESKVLAARSSPSREERASNAVHSHASSNLFDNVSVDRHRPATSVGFELSEKSHLPPRSSGLSSTQYHHSPPHELKVSHNSGPYTHHQQSHSHLQQYQSQSPYVPSSDRDVLSRADLSPEKDFAQQHYTAGRSAGASSIRGGDEYMHSRLQQSASTPAKHSWSETPSSATPGSVRGGSVSRISKLGSDLQALASKLDSFDSSAKSKY